MSNRIRSVGLWHSLMLNSCFLTPSYNTHVQGGRLSLFLPMVESHDLCEAESPKAMCNVMAIGYDWSWPTTVQIPLWEVRCDNCRLVTRQVPGASWKSKPLGALVQSCAYICCIAAGLASPAVCLPISPAIAAAAQSYSTLHHLCSGPPEHCPWQVTAWLRVLEDFTWFRWAICGQMGF